MTVINNEIVILMKLKDITSQRIFPCYNMYIFVYVKDEEAWKSPFEFDLVGRNLLSLFCIGTLSFVLNLLIEYNFFLKRR